jgi:hypothetical protein
MKPTYEDNLVIGILGTAILAALAVLIALVRNL